MRALPGREERVPPGEQPPARADAAAEQRRRILRVAADLIADRGYAGTSTDLLVRQARVGYATFYKFFPDKEAAFLALYDQTFEESSVKIAEAYGAEPDDRPWAERVAAAIRTFFTEISSDPPLWKTCLVESLTAGPQVLVRYEESIAQLAAAIKVGRREAPAAELPESLETILAGGIVWIAYQRLVAGTAAKELMGVVPDAIRFVLSPYLGEVAADDVATGAVAGG